MSGTHSIQLNSIQIEFKSNSNSNQIQILFNFSLKRTPAFSDISLFTHLIDTPANYVANHSTHPGT